MWTSNGTSTYWIDEQIPTTPNKEVTNHRYITPSLREIAHPFWTYDNGAYVTDEYLFNNHGYKVIVEVDPPNDYDAETGSNYFVSEKDPSNWVGIGSTALYRTFNRYLIVGPEEPVVNFDQKAVPEYTYQEEPTQIANKTYKVEQLSDYELEIKSSEYLDYLYKIKQSLFKADQIRLTTALSLGQTLTEEYKTYLQNLNSFDPADVDLLSLSNEEIEFLKMGAESFHISADSGHCVKCNDIEVFKNEISLSLPTIDQFVGITSFSVNS